MTSSASGIDLADLTVGPSQTWGAIRLVPLLRAVPIVDLRLHARLHDPTEASVVQTGPRTWYVSFVPHAFVADWTSDGTPAAAYGTQLFDPDRPVIPACIQLRYRRRMARRENRHRLRFLPLHLAMEGYLDLQFGGPPLAWEEWTRRAVTRGLSARVEASYLGASIPDLADALRRFEIHPDQCGAVLYVADALAAAFVVPHPDDYRVLHPTLLNDFYGELLYQYGCLYHRGRPSGPDRRGRPGVDGRAHPHGGWTLRRDRTHGHPGPADGSLHAVPVPAVLRPHRREPHRRDHH
jgi:hypothetical protein